MVAAMRSFAATGRGYLFCQSRQVTVMNPILPGEFLAGSLELVCYGFTVLAAVVSYVFLLR
jgi:hypothetical protein